MSRESGYQRITVERRGAICLVTLNHPPTLNALSDRTVAELSAALDGLETQVRVVIMCFRRSSSPLCLSG